MPLPAPTQFPGIVRLDRLNTLRALSIIGVFLFHILSALFAKSAASIEQFVTHSTGSLRWAEHIGLLLLSQAPRLVAIFFIISGYFIHRTFLLWVRRNHTYLAFSRFFLWRRFWRLVPPFWLALSFSYLLGYKHPLAWDSLRKFLVNATLFKTLVPGYFFSINYAHWYVAVQWQLDLLYPFFLYIIWRYSFRAAFITACTLAFLTNFVSPHFSTQPYINNLPFRWCLEWALGAYIAVAHTQKKRAFPHPRWLGSGVVIGLTLSGYFNLGPLTWALSLIGMALILEMFLLSRSRLHAIERPLASVALWSYSFYLLHVPIIAICQRALEAQGLTQNSPLKILLLVVSSFALSLGAAAICYRWVEEGSSSIGSRCWCIVQKIRASPQAPLFLARPHVRSLRQKDSIKSTV